MELFLNLHGEDLKHLILLLFLLGELGEVFDLVGALRGLVNQLEQADGEGDGLAILLEQQFHLVDGVVARHPIVIRILTTSFVRPLTATSWFM